MISRLELSNSQSQNLKENGSCISVSLFCGQKLEWRFRKAAERGAGIQIEVRDITEWRVHL